MSTTDTTTSIQVFTPGVPYNVASVITALEECTAKANFKLHLSDITGCFLDDGEFAWVKVTWNTPKNKAAKVYNKLRNKLLDFKSNDKSKEQLENKVADKVAEKVAEKAKGKAADKAQDKAVVEIANDSSGDEVYIDGQPVQSLEDLDPLDAKNLNSALSTFTGRFFQLNTGWSQYPNEGESITRWFSRLTREYNSRLSITTFFDTLRYPFLVNILVDINPRMTRNAVSQLVVAASYVKRNFPKENFEGSFHSTVMFANPSEVDIISELVQHVDFRKHGITRDQIDAHVMALMQDPPVSAVKDSSSGSSSSNEHAWQSAGRSRKPWKPKPKNGPTTSTQSNNKQVGEHQP